MKFKVGDTVRINDTQSDYHKQKGEVIAVGRGYIDVKIGKLAMRLVHQQVMTLAKEKGE